MFTPVLLPLLFAALANAIVQPGGFEVINGSTLTDPAQFNSVANLIVSQYLPKSVLPAVAVAIHSALPSDLQTSGDIKSIVNSALTAQSPPPFVTALPTPYAAMYSKIQAELSELRSEASHTLTSTMNYTLSGSSTIPGMMTTTNSAGSTYVIAVNYNSTITSSMSTSTTGSGAAPPPASTSSKGMAVHTQAPVVGPIAAVGFMGIVGILAAL